MYELIVYYKGPEKYKSRILRMQMHRWHFNPQLYNGKSSLPIWNGGVYNVSFRANDDYRDDLEATIEAEVDKLIANGIQIGWFGEFVVGSESLKISLKEEG